MERLTGYLQNRRFWLAVFGLLVVLFKDSIPGLEQIDWEAIAAALVILFGGPVVAQQVRNRNTPDSE